MSPEAFQKQFEGLSKEEARAKLKAMTVYVYMKQDSSNCFQIGITKDLATLNDDYCWSEEFYDQAEADAMLKKVRRMSRQDKEDLAWS